jgi:hypothetical protein
MKQLITVRDIEKIARHGGALVLSQKAILTPSAKDLIKEKNIRVIYEEAAAMEFKAASLPREGIIGGHSDYRRELQGLRQFMAATRLKCDILSPADEITTAAVAVLPRLKDNDRRLFFYLAGDGFRETAWMNKNSDVIAARCQSADEAQLLASYSEIRVIVFGMDFISNKQMYKSIHHILTMNRGTNG